MFLKTIQQAKRFFKILAGFTIILVGIILSIPGVPGPGFLTILAGLAILAGEYVWAQRVMDKLKHHGGKLRDAVFSKKNTPPQPDANPPQ
ncbi:MAG: PGPGW domain-containing protein [Acidobacteria bacterium]|nr:PGPGW domain-containing protein [Acidobacteriota bacterium]